MTRRSVAAAVAVISLVPALLHAASLLGREVHGGGTLEAEFPIGSYFQEYAATGGNPRPTTGRAVLMFPKNFEPSRPWPVVIVTSTTDMGRTSPMDAPWYREPATAEGWMVLATDATIKPRTDSTLWRLGVLAAALENIRRDWPQTAQWPVAFAGLSGGAKRSAVLAAMLAKSGTVRVCGVFLAGMNEDRVTPAYAEYKPPPNFLNVPIWLSSGDADAIAPPRLQEKAYYSMKRSGFKNVRLEGFFGRHQLNQSEVRRALKWFRELGKF